MNSTDVHKPMSSIPVTKGRKLYVAPACKRLSPAEAKELLLSHGDPEDPELQHILKRIEEIEKHSGS